MTALCKLVIDTEKYTCCVRIKGILLRSYTREKLLRYTHTYSNSVFSSHRIIFAIRHQFITLDNNPIQLAQHRSMVKYRAIFREPQIKQVRGGSTLTVHSVYFLVLKCNLTGKCDLINFFQNFNLQFSSVKQSTQLQTLQILSLKFMQYSLS